MNQRVRNAAFGLVAAVALTSTGAAMATTYDFTYVFAGDGAGNTLTGSFNGTGPINDITNITDIHMSLNGTALAGPFNAFSYTPTSTNCGSSSCFTLGGAVVSGDSSLSNFVFASAGSTADLGTANYFYVIQPWYNGSQTIAEQYAFGGNPNTFINYYNGQYVAANFSVSAVPEPAAWALMLVGFGGLGAALRSRRRIATAQV